MHDRDRRRAAAGLPRPHRGRHARGTEARLTPPFETDVVIVGAGPSGLAAACGLSDAGARVLVLDEQDAPGGQVHKAVERVKDGPPDLLRALGPDYAAGHALARRFRESGATYWPGATAWHLTDQRLLWVSIGQRSVPVRSRVVMLATGAMERPVPLPGWTLPGVFTAGALQSLIKSSGLVPSGRTVFVGSGPLLYLVAGQCIDLGAKPVAVIETAPRLPSLGVPRHLPRALTGDGPRMLAKGLAMRRRLRQAKVPIFAGASDIGIEGRDAAEAVSFRHRGIGNTVRCDVVALHEGVIPNTQFARLIGCDLVWNARQRCFEPVVDGYGNSSIDGVMIIGDGASIEGAAAAECRGELAAWEALRHLGRVSAEERDRRSAGALRGRARQRAIRPLLDALYPPPAAILTPRDGTIVCRCEEITAGTIREAIAGGVRKSDQLKGATRCGMGPCQGRLCGPVVAEIIAAETGQSAAEVGLFRVRVPLKPITMGELSRRLVTERVRACCRTKGYRTITAPILVPSLRAEGEAIQPIHRNAIELIRTARLRVLAIPRCLTAGLLRLRLAMTVEGSTEAAVAEQTLIRMAPARYRGMPHSDRSDRCA